MLISDFYKFSVTCVFKIIEFKRFLMNFSAYWCQSNFIMIEYCQRLSHEYHSELPALLIKMRGFNLPWWGSKTMTEIWTWVKIPYGILNRGKFFKGSKYHMILVSLLGYLISVLTWYLWQSLRENLCLKKDKISMGCEE